MRELFYLGSCPCEEMAAQTLDPDFHAKNKAECLAYIKAIRRVVGKEPEGAQLSIKTESGHDFGTYREVVVYFDPDSIPALEYAQKCDEHAPTTWEEAGMEPPRINKRGRD